MFVVFCNVALLVGVPLLLVGLVLSGWETRPLWILGGAWLVIVGIAGPSLHAVRDERIEAQVQNFRDHSDQSLLCTDYVLLGADKVYVVTDWVIEGERIIDRDHGRIWDVSACSFKEQPEDRQ